MIKPLTPKEAKKTKLEVIPDFVIQAFNELIVKNLNSYGSSSFKQNDLVDIIMKSSSQDNGFTRDDVYSNHWLDVEKIYEEAGWEVTFHKPAYYEDFDPYYNFIPKKNENKQ